MLVAKYADHLPLYRQEHIFARSGVKLARSSLAEWVGVCGVRLQPLGDALRDAILAQPILHADETPVQVLEPGSKKTHRAYLWAYTPGVFQDLNAVVYDFTPGRSGSYARTFLGNWNGQLVCDDYAGYKACFEQGITEIGCMAHARRKFFELHQSAKSHIADQALQSIGQLYALEAQAADLSPQQRQHLREQHSRPIAQTLHAWMQAHRIKVPDGSGIAKALDYSLKRWGALTRYLDDGRLPIGRVEMWRGGWNWHSVGPYQKIRHASNRLGTPFPHPAHRTGRADFPHPALFRVNKPSHSRGRCAFVNGSAPTCRIGTGRSIGDTPFPVSLAAASTRFADVAPCSRQSSGTPY